MSAAPAFSEDGDAKLGVTVSVAGCLKDANHALAPVLACIPGWTQEAAACAQVDRISGAMTNLVFRAHSRLASPSAATAIVRVFGRGSRLFSRHQERGIFLAASRLGLGPRCLLEFENGRVEEFLPGATPTAASMRAPHVAAAIAAALAEFHVSMTEALPLIRSATGCEELPGHCLEGASPRADVGGEQSAVWERLRGWLQLVHGVAAAEASDLGLDSAAEELAAAEAACERKWGATPLLACCHNDLQYGNVLLEPGAAAAEHGGSDGEEALPVARLIDYEYCTVNDIGFDLANHFCEYAADYHADAACVLDWARLPDERQASHFCTAYAAAVLRGFEGSALAASLRRCVEAGGAAAAENGDAVAAAAEVVRARSNAFEALSHLKWGIWGLIQASTSDVDFDYSGYAALRIRQYHATKHRLLE